MTEKNKLLIKLVTVLLVVLALVAFRNPARSINKSIENVYSQIKGEVEPDTNIIIIHISANDIDRIGPWPIKRSYYALLINGLTKQQVRTIGLEIFLSSRFVTQSIYEDLLKNEILKSGRVVLSSKAGKLIEIGGQFYTDSLSYPSPKLLDENIATGHLNYQLIDELIIPTEINYNEIKEQSFSQKLSGLNRTIAAIPVNYISSWKKFKNYSVTEYFNLLQSDSGMLQKFRDKIVIIGISDEQIAYTFNTSFDEIMPGAALHAFAVDNHLNSRYYDFGFYFASTLFFSITVLLLLFIHHKKTSRKFIYYLLYVLVFILITFLIYTSLNIKLALAFFLLPFLAVILVDGIFGSLTYRNMLKGMIDESEVLKSLLKNKESELTGLQNELDMKDGDGSGQLIDKIKILKNEIDRLKENEEDKLAAAIQTNNDIQEFFGMVYRSKEMAKAVELIEKAAPTNSTILIFGESGTGKELAANAIHSLSKRKNNNFITVNCGALSENLLESELFGHVKGSFTGALTDKIGKFEAADKGTIFLDEIGEISENFQVKLLRVLQSGDIEKVGSSIEQKVDVRVIAATNIDLESAVKGKKFREDLYYRINVFKIELPPLRNRKEDIEALSMHFLVKSSGDLKISSASINSLMEYDWKGNVRELESIINRAAIFAKSANRNLIQLADLPDNIVKSRKVSFEELVLESLRNKNFSHSSISETARELGNVNRTLISENFRGIVLKTLVGTNFDIEETVRKISVDRDEEIKEKVRSKIRMYLNNIDVDLANSPGKNFESIKQNFNSKYKNLPAKFHLYLDEVIKFKLNL